VSTHHRLSDLLGCEVVDESGGTLGHVHDVVCDRRPAGGMQALSSTDLIVVRHQAPQL